MTSVVLAEATEYEQHLDGSVYFIRNLFGSPLESAPGPQAFSVEIREAGGIIRPHFHSVEQFQVVVAGSGRLGKHALSPVTIHYADAFTPYGPIVAGVEGLRYLTLRAEADPEAPHYMPGAKDKMSRRAGRSFTHQSELWGMTLTEASERVLLSDPHAGLYVLEAVIPGSHPLSHSSLPDGARGYLLVLRGEAVDDGQRVPSIGCAFFDASSLSDFSAAPKGAHVVFLLFPGRE
jgi:hypothetical protein